MNLLKTISLEQLKKGVTQSELATWDTCHTKWNLAYNNQLEKRGEYNWNFVVGSALHEFLDQFYKGLNPDPNQVSMEEPEPDVDVDSEEFKTEKEYWVSITAAMQKAYARKYAKDLLDYKFPIVEEVVIREFMGYTFTGKIDIGMDNQIGFGIMDHKSTKNLGYLTEVGWDFKLQFQFYPWLLQDRNPRYFTVNGVKKPQLRQTKKETRKGFILRCVRDFAVNPDEYFQRETMPINPKQIKEFETKVLIPKIAELELAVIHPVLIQGMNTNNCNAYFTPCQFLPICRQGWKANQFQYARRALKHQELPNEKTKD